MTKHRRQASRLSLIKKFAVRALIVIVCIATIEAAIFTSTLRQYGEYREKLLTEQHVLKEAEGKFPLEFFENPEVFDMDEISRLCTDTFLFGDIFRVKLWDQRATVIWSDEERNVGQRFPDNPLLAAALAGEVTGKCREPDDEEHVYEKGRTDLFLEVYVPVRREPSGEVVGVIEVYRDAQVLLATSQFASLKMWGVTAGGAIALFLALIGILRAGQKEQVRLEGSLAEYSRSLEEEKQKLDAILNGVGAGLSLVDRDHTIRWVNNIARDWFSQGEDLVGKTCHRAIWGSDRMCENCPTERVFQGQSFGSCEHFSTPGRGPARYFEVYSSPIKGESGESRMAVEVIQDVTVRKTLEGRLVQAGQFAAVGELAARVAHEVNNPVGIISSLTKLLISRSSELDLPDEVRADLEKIDTSSDRIAQVTTSLLSFARPSKSERMPVYIAEIVDECLGLIGRALIAAGLRVIKDIPDDLPPVLGHRSRLGQVLLNLVNNAADAMPQGGRLSISAGRESGQNGEGRIWMRVSDSGPGIPEGLGNSVFEPFVTTKKAGKGTGLGLAVSRDIVREHGGEISIESTSDKGTTFRILLPEAPRTAASRAAGHG